MALAGLEALDELFGGSDRARAIVGVELLSSQLESILRAFMVGPRHSVDRLLDPGPASPLGSLSARITACEACALIPAHTADDLRRVAKIRNRFAHELQCSFDEDSIRDHVRELHSAKLVQVDPGPLATRTAFSAAAAARWWQLGVIRDAVTGGRRPEPPIELIAVRWTNDAGFVLRAEGHESVSNRLPRLKPKFLPEKGHSFSA